MKFSIDLVGSFIAINLHFIEITTQLFTIVPNNNQGENDEKDKYKKN